MAESKGTGSATATAAPETTPSSAETTPVEQPQVPVFKGAKQDEDERGPRFAIAYGQHGANVADLQTALNKKLDKDSQLEVDGSFGTATATAVKEWQRNEGFAADAVVTAEQAKKLGF